MDGSPDLKNAGAAETYAGPPDYRVVGRHGVFPETSHDEIARFNFLAHMNRHLSTKVMPALKTVWERRAGPAFEARQGRAPKDRHEVRKALLDDPYYQAWSALRRATMEQRQQAGRWIALRQAEPLSAKVDALTKTGLSWIPPCRFLATSRRSITTACPAATTARSSLATCQAQPTMTAASSPRRAGPLAGFRTEAAMRS